MSSKTSPNKGVLDRDAPEWSSISVYDNLGTLGKHGEKYTLVNRPLRTKVKAKHHGIPGSSGFT